MTKKTLQNSFVPFKGASMRHHTVSMNNYAGNSSLILLIYSIIHLHNPYKLFIAYKYIGLKFSLRVFLWWFYGSWCILHLSNAFHVGRMQRNQCKCRKHKQCCNKEIKGWTDDSQSKVHQQYIWIISQQMSLLSRSWIGDFSNTDDLVW